MITAEEFIATMEGLLTVGPVNGLEVHLITDGLECPRLHGQNITSLAISYSKDEPEPFFYQACYFEDAAEGQSAMTATRQGAIALLNEGLDLYRAELKDELEASQD